SSISACTTSDHSCSIAVSSGVSPQFRLGGYHPSCTARSLSEAMATDRAAPPRLDAGRKSPRPPLGRGLAATCVRVTVPIHQYPGAAEHHSTEDGRCQHDDNCRRLRDSHGNKPTRSRTDDSKG